MACGGHATAAARGGGVLVWLPMLNLRLRETIQSIDHGSVLMVSVHLCPSSRGSSGDTSVSQRPVPLSQHTSVHADVGGGRPNEGFRRP